MEDKRGVGGRRPGQGETAIFMIIKKKQSKSNVTSVKGGFTVEPFRSITSPLCYADDSQLELLVKPSEHNKHAKFNSDNTLEFPDLLAGHDPASARASSRFHYSWSTERLALPTKSSRGAAGDTADQARGHFMLFHPGSPEEYAPKTAIMKINHRRSV
ncbi:hypothetical protein EYF80_020368 [Liparis tanakae]|uniref:Uncharacterized protein n=1 Tax=Liparis tanakae TaxID=230148 RepID=A0A4Z2HUL1_9TELE|nr:hypothetical protein EYF80_020368 [Liparis tanakae]